ncbi:MAG: GSCFA domain-containing protein [Saprospiraceae bacterium]
MESYRTRLVVPKSNNEILHQTNLMSIGSCFSEHIGKQLLNYKFPILINPHGILFNPISIADSLTQIIHNQLFSESDIFYFNNRWQSFYHHGRFAKADKKECLNEINTSIQSANIQLQKLDFLILTFGTANVFEYKQTSQIVANCHKVPNTEFERKRLKIDDITTAFESIFKQLKTINPKLKIILTVSPVRHIRDGLIENQRSKSTLLLAVDELVNRYDFVEYFPSYELVIDDLRDYRFYKEDMIHPSNVAINYVWNHFENAYFSDNTRQINKQIQKLIQAKNHRPFDVNSENHQQFLKSQISKINNLRVQYPFLDFEDNLKWFRCL